MKYSRFTFHVSRRLSRGLAGGFRGFAGLDLDGHDDVVALLFEFEDELDVGDFVGDAEIDGSRGTEEIHRLERVRIPRFYISEV